MCHRQVSQTPIPAAPSSIVKKPTIQRGLTTRIVAFSVAAITANFKSQATAPTSRRPVAIRSHLTSAVFVMSRP